jgi:hypothetical protein
VFSGGQVSFGGAVFSGGWVGFGGAEFSGGQVDFSHAEFCGGHVDFSHAEFCGGQVDFSAVRRWSLPPNFDFGSSATPGVLLPGISQADSADSSAGSAPGEARGFCPTCGSYVIARCPNCRIRIRGDLHVPGLTVFDEYRPSAFCDGCGEPYAWATRQDRIYQLENLLDEEDIDDSTKLLVREDLERLRTAGAGLDDEAQLAIGGRIKNRAPGLLSGAAWNIGQGLLGAYLRQKLGLPAG